MSSQPQLDLVTKVGRRGLVLGFVTGVVVTAFIAAFAVWNLLPDPSNPACQRRGLPTPAISPTSDFAYIHADEVLTTDPPSSYDLHMTNDNEGR